MSHHQGRPHRVPLLPMLQPEPQSCPCSPHHKTTHNITQETAAAAAPHPHTLITSDPPIE
jgi:hypothetical protein